METMPEQQSCRQAELGNSCERPAVDPKTSMERDSKTVFTTPQGGHAASETTGDKDHDIAADMGTARDLLNAISSKSIDSSETSGDNTVANIGTALHRPNAIFSKSNDSSETTGDKDQDLASEMGSVGDLVSGVSPKKNGSSETDKMGVERDTARDLLNSISSKTNGSSETDNIGVKRDAARDLVSKVTSETDDNDSEMKGQTNSVRDLLSAISSPSDGISENSDNDQDIGDERGTARDVLNGLSSKCDDRSENGDNDQDIEVERGTVRDVLNGLSSKCDDRSENGDNDQNTGGERGAARDVLNGLSSKSVTGGGCTMGLYSAHSCGDIQLQILPLDTGSNLDARNDDTEEKSTSDVTSDDVMRMSVSDVTSDDMKEESASCVMNNDMREQSASDVTSDDTKEQPASGIIDDSVMHNSASDVERDTDNVTDNSDSRIRSDDVTEKRDSSITVDHTTEDSSTGVTNDCDAEKPVSGIPSDGVAPNPASDTGPNHPACGDCKIRQKNCPSQQASPPSTQHAHQEPVDADAQQEEDSELWDDDDNWEGGDEVREIIRMVRACRLFMPGDDDEDDAVHNRVGGSDDDDDDGFDDDESDPEWSWGVCAICTDEGLVLTRACCQLCLCSPCLSAYLSGKVEEGIVHIQCPGQRCHASLSEYEILSKLPLADLKAKFRRFLRQAHRDAGTKTCPRCTLEYRVGDTETATKMAARGLKVTCSSCRFDWCFPCHAPWHEGETCKSWRKRATREFRKWTKERDPDNRGQINAHSCPGCRVYISRSEGCPNMVCSQCGTEFCYNCGQKLRNSRLRRNPVFRFLLGRHHSRFTPLGCPDNLLPHSPAKRRLIRGSLLGGKVVGGVVLAGPVLVCAVVALLGFGVFVTVRKGVRLCQARGSS